MLIESALRHAAFSFYFGYDIPFMKHGRAFRYRQQKLIVRFPHSCPAFSEYVRFQDVLFSMHFALKSGVKIAQNYKKSFANNLGGSSLELILCVRLWSSILWHIRIEDVQSPPLVASEIHTIRLLLKVVWIKASRAIGDSTNTTPA